MTDKVLLNNKIQEAAELYLSDIQNMNETQLQDNLRYFSEKAKEAAESILEDYIFSVFNKYTEGPLAITDADRLSRFVDFNNGYQQKMLDWIKEHKLEIKEEYFELPNKPTTVEYKDNKPLVVLGVGTAIAVGLFIFTNRWIALIAEMLVIAFFKVAKDRSNKHREEMLEIERKKYLLDLESRKNTLVNGMIDELDQWLDMGEKASNEILISYNL